MGTMRTLSHPEPADEQQQQVPAWLLDLLLGIAVALVLALVISTDQGGRRNPDVVAYLCAGGFGTLMLARRRFPVAALVATMVLLFAYYTLGYPSIGLAVPVVAALYSAAEGGRLGAAVVVSLILIVVSTFFRLRDGESAAFLLGYELVSAGALMAAAIALGEGARVRRALRAEQAQTARLIAQEHAARAEQRVEAERLRIARDLHDVLGHSIAVISLQAHVAREALGRDEAQARQALAHIRDASAATLRDLRATVRLLRSPTSEPAEGALSSLAHLATLLDGARASGLHIAAQIDGDLSGLPAAVDAAAYRIVQEALTNVLRHAAATQVELAIAVDGSALRLLVRDNGRGGRGAAPVGNGIAGMTERARLLGGTLRARPHPSGGFEVRATLPLEEAA